jgi:hypothetical protein
MSRQSTFSSILSKCTPKSARRAASNPGMIQADRCKRTMRKAPAPVALADSLPPSTGVSKNRNTGSQSHRIFP